MTRPLLLPLWLLLCLGSPANVLLATDYYVSGSGSDGNSGVGPGVPFRTLSHAMAMAGNGDRIIVGSGTYNAAAGEVFPIQPSDGVEILGPGDGTAIVNSISTLQPPFDVGSLVNTTTVSGLSLLAPETAGATSVGAAIRVSGLPADLHVTNNTVSNGFFLLSNIGVTADGGAVGITVDGNTTTGNVNNGVVWRAVSGTAVHRLTVTNNTISINPANAAVYLSALTNATISATVTGNVCDGGGALRGVYLGTVPGDFSNSTITGLVADNQLTSFMDGIDVDLDSVGDLAQNSSMNVTLRSNRILLCGDGIDIRALASSSGSLAGFHGLIECNTISNSGNDGIAVRVSAFTNVATCTATFDPVIRYNDVTGSGDAGLQLDASATGSAGSAFCTPQVRGNLFTGNTGCGIDAGMTLVGGGSVALMDPDLGQAGATNLGRNTLSGNGGFALDLGGLQDNSQTVMARGNWWGANNTAAIELLVRHQADNPGLALADFAGFLSNTLNFTASPANPTPGQLVTLTAVNAPFLAKAGSLLLSALANGTPLTGLVIAADGTTIRFTVPLGTAEGSYNIVVTNPGGQSGSVTITVGAGALGGGTADSGGGGGLGCFVATASYGDEDAPEVLALRRWRDECLSANPLGRQLVRAYYACSPPLAQAIAERPWARLVARAGLAPVVGAVRLWMDAQWVFGLAAALWLWRRLRRAGS